MRSDFTHLCFLDMRTQHPSLPKDRATHASKEGMLAIQGCDVHTLR